MFFPSIRSQEVHVSINELKLNYKKDFWESHKSLRSKLLLTKWVISLDSGRMDIWLAIDLYICLHIKVHASLKVLKVQIYKYLLYISKPPSRMLAFHLLLCPKLPGLLLFPYTHIHTHTQILNFLITPHNFLHPLLSCLKDSPGHAQSASFSVNSGLFKMPLNVHCFLSTRKPLSLREWHSVITTPLHTLSTLCCTRSGHAGFKWSVKSSHGKLFLFW